MALTVVLLAAVALWRWSGDDYVVPPAPDAGSSGTPAGARDPGIDVAGAQRALARLVSALDDRDAQAAADVAGPGAGDLLRAVAANAGALDVTGLAMRYVDEVGAVGPDGGWSAAVDLTWRFGEVDPGDASEEVLVDFGETAGGAVVVDGIGGGDRRTPLWLSGPLDVRRSATALVLAAPGAESPDVLLARATAAVSVVERVLPAWSGPLVVEAPGSQADLETALDAEPGSYASVAAVTATVDGSTEVGAPTHVFVNPGVYDDLDPIGAQVVLSHEATHVATDAPVHALPPWLLEGFADYVALRDVDLPLATTAGQVLAQVRADGPPDALPDQADFAQGTDGFGAAYEAAWLACRVLAEQAGEQTLVQVYDQVTDGVDVRRALRAEAGTTLTRLTRAWRARLQELAS